jgi:hypothetical protein
LASDVGEALGSEDNQRDHEDDEDLSGSEVHE